MNYNWKATALMGIGTAKAPILKACRRDQRFSYFLYLPKGFQEESASEYMITVVVHGTTRNAEKLKNVFAEYADEMKSLSWRLCSPQASSMRRTSTIISL